MKFLVDMNLSPSWIPTLKEHDVDAVHWSDVGKPDASDQEIFRKARKQNYVVFTHDLDFGDILAATGARGPSVIQVRTEDTTPEELLPIFLSSIKQFESHLLNGAIITIDAEKTRARILPIEESKD